MSAPDVELLDLARAAREHAVAPYSHFRVGAALRGEDGRVFTGCNIESASFGLTMCAERVALFKAISAGVKRYTSIAIVADTARPTPPCGACRQLLWEFGGNMLVILGNLTVETARHQLKDLFPFPFDSELLNR